MPALWEDRLPLYIAYLIDNKRKSATIMSYISAIRVVLKDNNISIHDDQFLMALLTRACRLNNDRIHIRLPIRRSMLQVIINSTIDYYMGHNQAYLASLYSALFSTAYFGLFRVGEITKNPHTVKAVDVHIAENKKKLLFVLRSSKTHNLGDLPQMIKITSLESNSSSLQTESCGCLKLSCSYDILHHYIELREGIQNVNEPFFIFRDSTAVNSHQLCKTLKIILDLSGFDSSKYSSHSFHVGHCCDLLKAGLSIETIKKLGCWKSNVVFNCLKNY